MRIISVATLKALWEVPEHRDADHPLTDAGPWLPMIRALGTLLNLPADVLVPGYEVGRVA
jgi:hypothetical protein